MNLSTGPGGFEVHGPATKRFVAQLSGRGEVFGTKFTPAGFYVFSRVPMRELVDGIVSVQAAIGETWIAMPQIRWCRRQRPVQLARSLADRGCAQLAHVLDRATAMKRPCIVGCALACAIGGEARAQEVERDALRAHRFALGVPIIDLALVSSSLGGNPDLSHTYTVFCGGIALGIGRTPHAPMNDAFETLRAEVETFRRSKEVFR